jgi:hypothetical protein
MASNIRTLLEEVAQPLQLIAGMFMSTRRGLEEAVDLISHFSALDQALMLTLPKDGERRSRKGRPGRQRRRGWRESRRESGVSRRNTLMAVTW